LRSFREAAVEAMPDNFTDEDKYQKRLALLSEQHDREKEKLYAQIGELSTELQWLKKSCKLRSVERTELAWSSARTGTPRVKYR
jgi:hypothetical protein